MLNGQDVVVLLKLAGYGEDWTVRSFESALGIPRAGVHRSLQRLSAACLYDLERRRTNLSQAEEFLVHALKYLFPPELNGETRGVPTVWPDPHGRQRGIALRPLHRTAPDLARRDPELAEGLAISTRSGSGRARPRACNQAPRPTVCPYRGHYMSIEMENSGRSGPAPADAQAHRAPCRYIRTT